MKTPRVSDFDPNAKVPTLKSPLEGMPAIGKPPQSTPQVKHTTENELPVAESSNQPYTDRATGRRTDEATGRPGNKRLLVRRGFEWYEDQLRALKRLSLHDQMEGKGGSMSAMVREALDDYLEKRNAEK